MKTVTTFCLAMIAILFGAVSLEAFAQAAAVVATPTFLDSILAWIASSPSYLSGVVLALEFALRLIPTTKSLSLLVPLQYAFKGVATILNWVSDTILSPLITNANNTTPAAK